MDNPPYVFTGWLLDADDDTRRAVQSTSVKVLADIHAITEPASKLPAMVAPAGVSSLRRHVENERAYYEWTRREDGLRIPVLERAFEWLETNWPADPSEDVLCWGGDARIGNILYRGTDAGAVLDWESAALAPRELDLAGSSSSTACSRTSPTSSQCQVCPDSSALGRRGRVREDLRSRSP